MLCNRRSGPEVFCPSWENDRLEAGAYDLGLRLEGNLANIQKRIPSSTDKDWNTVPGILKCTEWNPEYMRRNHQQTKACISTVFKFSDHAYLSLREPKLSTFPLSISSSSIHPSGYPLPLRRLCSGCCHFLEGQYFPPSKARCFGQITISSPSSSNKPTRASSCVALSFRGYT